MIRRPAKLSPNLLYLGIVWFVLLLAGILARVGEDWRQSMAGGRARAIYELVHSYIPNRPTDTPGAIAWLHWELRNYLETKGVHGQALSVDLADWQDYRTIPSAFQPLSQLLLTSTPEPTAVSPAELTWTEPEPEALAAMRFRTQFFLHHGPHSFVVTRRRALGGAGPNDASDPANRFLYQAIARLERAAAQLDRLGPETPGVARLYCLCEDGSLITLPIAPGGASPAQRAALLAREGEQLRKMPKLPNFVSNEFFFVFDFDQDHKDQPFFSGLYLDLGDQGMIVSLTAPLQGQAGLLGVLGMDVTFELDWRDFARHVESPLVVEAVTLAETKPSERWRPWSALERANQLQDERLKRAVSGRARGELEARHFHNPSPIYHDIAEGEGALVAFRARPDTWLVILFPEQRTRFPLWSILLLGGLFAVLFAGFEWNRQRAESAQREAVREFEEKQNLLETMGVPLMVVDPNSEEVVFSNKAADALGIRKGGRFTDIVLEDAAVREHYQRMQQAGGEQRRAYGLPLRIGNEVRYAVVRSVAVRAPIRMIGADERHRLGILFLIEPEEDLRLLTGELSDRVRLEEQRKLSGLLSHGVDTLARVLNRRLEKGEHSAFDAWLAGYIQHRIRVVAWLLDQWSATERPARKVFIGPDHVRTTTERMSAVFEEARRDAGLRAQLQWNNGILADAIAGEAPLIEASYHWNDDFIFALPVRGGLGLFLNEAMVNALRHGRPGSRPRFKVELDRLRMELTFSLENEVREGAHSERQGKKYGGRSILERLAWLFDWRELSFQREDGLFRLSWRVAVVERHSDESD